MPGGRPDPTWTRGQNTDPDPDPDPVCSDKRDPDPDPEAGPGRFRRGLTAAGSMLGGAYGKLKGSSITKLLGLGALIFAFNKYKDEIIAAMAGILEYFSDVYDVFKADGRCYHCQMNYEMDLEFDSKLRWFAYRRLKDLRNMEALEKDMEQWVEDITRQRERNPFDETVANALANGEVSMQINKNKA